MAEPMEEQKGGAVKENVDRLDTHTILSFIGGVDVCVFLCITLAFLVLLCFADYAEKLLQAYLVVSDMLLILAVVMMVLSVTCWRLEISLYIKLIHSWLREGAPWLPEQIRVEDVEDARIVSGFIAVIYACVAACRAGVYYILLLILADANMLVRLQQAHLAVGRISFIIFIIVMSSKRFYLHKMSLYCRRFYSWLEDLS